MLRGPAAVDAFHELRLKADGVFGLNASLDSFRLVFRSSDQGKKSDG